MLVLSRRRHEVVVLTLPDGRQVVVTVVEARDGKVRLGFNAPPDVPINRGEVQDDIDASSPAKAPSGPVVRSAPPRPPDVPYIPRKLREGR